LANHITSQVAKAHVFELFVFVHIIFFKIEKVYENLKIAIFSNK
jgi:hypothetical protein